MLSTKTEQQKLKSLQEEHKIKLNQFSGAFNLADVLITLEKAVANSQAELQLLEPQTNEEDDFFVIFPIKIEITGQYKNLLEFINNIFEQPHFTTIEELILENKTPNGKNEEISMQALLMVYKNKSPATDKPAPIKTISITPPKHNIFAKESDVTNLFLWSTKELNFLGTLKQNGNIFGFVSDPFGTIHQVTIGDKIGLKQSKITAIDKRGITTKDENESIYKNKI